MDYLITYEEATGFLKNPPSLVPRPDFVKLRALRKHFITGLTPLVCPQSLIHGWTGIVMDPVMYALLEPTMPFAAITDPGNFAVYQKISTDAVIKMTNKVFARNKNYYLSFININRACFRTLNNNIGNQFKVSNLANMTGWNSSMSIRTIFEQLEQSYGKPEAMALFHNDTLFCSTFPATEAPEMLFHQIKQCKDIQTIAQDPYTPTHIINNAVRLLMSSSIFPLKEFDTWEAMAVKLYPLLKPFIHEAYARRLTSI